MENNEKIIQIKNELLEILKPFEGSRIEPTTKEKLEYHTEQFLKSFNLGYNNVNAYDKGNGKWEIEVE